MTEDGYVHDESEAQHEAEIKALRELGRVLKVQNMRNQIIGDPLWDVY